LGQFSRLKKKKNKNKTSHAISKVKRRVVRLSYFFFHVSARRNLPPEATNKIHQNFHQVKSHPPPTPPPNPQHQQQQFFAIQKIEIV
jgi:hypothetical protein